MAAVPLARPDLMLSEHASLGASAVVSRTWLAQSPRDRGLFHKLSTKRARASTCSCAPTCAWRAQRNLHAQRASVRSGTYTPELGRPALEQGHGGYGVHLVDPWF